MKTQIQIQMSNQITYGIAVGMGASNHFHEQIEVLYNMGNDVEVRINGQANIIHKGDIVIIGSMTPHATFSADKSDYTILVAELMPSFFMPFDQDIEHRRILQPILQKSSGVAYQFFADICQKIYTEYLTDQPTKDVFLRALGFMLAAGILRYMPTESLPNARSHVQFKQIIDRISHDPLRDFAIEDLARECGLSVSRFSHVFTEVTGISFERYKLRNRLLIVKDQLQHKNCSLESIAKLCRFHSRSHLTRVFKQYYGLTPTAYQKLNPNDCIAKEYNDTPTVPMQDETNF